MDLPRADIEHAKTLCANFGAWYRGTNPLNTGFSIEDPEERAAAIEACWTEWSSFARNYFMAMLNTLGGHSTLALQSEITHNCTPLEARGARTAVDVFWRRDLALRGPIERRGGWAFTPVQLAILGNETVNAEVFQHVERTMEATIGSTLRTRRNIMRQIDDTVDHDAGLREDFDHFFARGRPLRLSAKERNKRYDGMLI